MYRLNGPLRCYQSYTTCAEVKAAGLPSGVYWLDADGADGTLLPFEVYCKIEADSIMGFIEHDSMDPVSVKPAAGSGDTWTTCLHRSCSLVYRCRHPMAIQRICTTADILAIVHCITLLISTS